MIITWQHCLRDNGLGYKSPDAAATAVSVSPNVEHSSIIDMKSLLLVLALGAVCAGGARQARHYATSYAAGAGGSRFVVQQQPRSYLTYQYPTAAQATAAAATPAATSASR